MRSPEELDINKLGLKSMDLSKNCFGNRFCEQLSVALKSDEYMRCINLQKNNIQTAGFKHLAEAIFQHPTMISIDLRFNPGYTESKANKYKKIMQNTFTQNLKHDVTEFEFKQHRINIEWVRPSCFGLESNRLHE